MSRFLDFVKPTIKTVLMVETLEEAKDAEKERGMNIYFPSELLPWEKEGEPPFFILFGE